MTVSVAAAHDSNLKLTSILSIELRASMALTFHMCVVHGNKDYFIIILSLLQVCAADVF